MTFEIEDGILKKCKPEPGVTSVTVPEGVTAIGDEAFIRCNELAVVVLPEGVTTIGQFSFAYCRNLSVIMLPKSLKEIGSFAFSGCENLDNVSIPEGLTFLGNGVFFHCSGLSHLELPQKITKIGSETFYGCTGMRSLKLSDELTEVGRSAFFSCDNLVDITFPRSLKSIELYNLLGPKVVGYYDTTYIVADSLPDSSTLLVERSSETDEVMFKIFVSSDNEPYENHDMLIESMADGHIDAGAFDSCFTRLSDTGNRCMMALYRMECPRKLSVESKARYECYLKEHAAAAVEKLAAVGDMDGIRSMADMEIFNGENMEACIEAAAAEGFKTSDPVNTQINAYLMNYKNEHFGSEDWSYLALD